MVRFVMMLEAKIIFKMQLCIHGSDIFAIIFVMNLLFHIIFDVVIVIVNKTFLSALTV